MKNTHNKKEDAWENGELGASEEYVRKVTSDREKRLDDQLGLQTISIRLQKGLISSLKKLAQEDGIGYQPYIRQILMRHIRHVDHEKRERAKRNKELLNHR